MENIKDKLSICERRRNHYRGKRDGSKITFKMLQTGIPKAIGNGYMYIFYDRKCEKYDVEIKKLNDEKWKQQEHYKKLLDLLSVKKL